MTTTGQRMGGTAATAAPAVVRRPKGTIVVNWITSTDHKTIGYMYLISSFVFFCAGGVMALLIRAELFEPGMQILQTKEQYNPYISITPNRTGEYMGKCAELCGEYHSEMLFKVRVVTQQEYDSHIADLKAKGNTGNLGTDFDRAPISAPAPQALEPAQYRTAL